MSAGVREIRYGVPKWKAMKSKISMEIRISRARKKVLLLLNASFIVLPRMRINMIRISPRAI